MSPPATPERPPLSALTRGSALLAALALALPAAAEYREWRQGKRDLLAALTRHRIAVRAPAMAADVARETDPVRGALRAARGLLVDELDRSWQSDLPPEERTEAREAGLVKLELARELAMEALARRPASWQAAQVLGATRYLETVRRGLPMDEERRRAWQDPLAAARRLGPGQSEPLRFLAAATLSEWPRLGAEERQEAVALLEEALVDPQSFDLLARTWLRIAPSRQLAFSVIPAQPRAWAAVERFYAERGDWGPLAEAHTRGGQALHQRLRHRLELAERRLAGGDRRRARWYALEVLEKASPSHRDRPLVEAALEILPPGPVGEIRARRLAAWLDWSRELCLLGSCPFSAPTLARMAGLAALEEPSERAAAAEMADDPRSADRASHGQETLSPRWAPFHLLRARRLLDAGRVAEARRSLERVHSSWSRRAAYLELAARLTRPTGASDAVWAPAAVDWPARAWLDGLRPTIELRSPASCRRVEVEIQGISGGSAVEVFWDGHSTGTFPVAAGRVLRLELEVKADSLHRLELEPFAHPALRPGRVRLRACRS